MTPEHVQRLHCLADMTLQAAQARLLRIAQSEANLRAQIAELSRCRAAAAVRDCAGDVALAAGVDGRWHQWIAVRQTHLNTELLQVIELRRLQTIVVRKAFGRAIVVKEIVDSSRSDTRRQQIAREDRNG